MKITKICLIQETDGEKLNPLFSLMTVFCSATRYAYNRLIENEKPSELIKRVYALFRLNKRYAEDAVLQAQTIVSSQKELLPIRIEASQSKIEQTESKIEAYQSGKKKPKKVPLEVCLSGLQQRVRKWQAKEQELLAHQEAGTLPAVIFGGKRNFFDRMKGKLSKQEWKDLRSNTLYARGDKTKGGNLNIRVVWVEAEQQAYLEVANPLALAEGKKHSPRLRFLLHIPDKHVDGIIRVVMPTVLGKTPKGKDIEEYQPYSVELKRKNGNVYVHLTYDMETYGSERKGVQSFKADQVAGIDVNVDKVAVSIVTKQGNRLASRTFYCHEMEYASSNKRSNLAGELAKQVVEYLLLWNVGGIVLEDITLKQTHDTNKRFNRLTHQFAKTKMQKALISRGLKFGFQMKKVNPAYTSVIGRFKYSKKYGLSVHEAASFVIGRRGLGLDEKIPAEWITVLREKIKPRFISILGSMEESERKSKWGKQRRKFLGMMLKNIEEFKQNHSWKLWNVIHKTLWVKNQEIQLKEV